MQIRLIIADDHDAMREKIKSFLSKCSDIDIVGEAKDGKTAVELVRKLSPDIALLDITMPSLNGIEATRSIINSNTQTRVVILSANADPVFVLAGIEVGISGYVLKSVIPEDLIPALHTAMANELFLSVQIADALNLDRSWQQPKADDSVA